MRLLLPFRRLGLARALYSRSSVVLIDDTMSALDEAVAETVWRDGIGRRPGSESMLDNEARARVVVTHNTALIDDADVVVVRSSLLVYLIDVVLRFCLSPLVVAMVMMWFLLCCRRCLLTLSLLVLP